MLFFRPSSLSELALTLLGSPLVIPFVLASNGRLRLAINRRAWLPSSLGLASICLGFHLISESILVLSRLFMFVHWHSNMYDLVGEIELLLQLVIRFLTRYQSRSVQGSSTCRRWLIRHSSTFRPSLLVLDQIISVIVNMI